MGITGANFAVAETGTVVLVTNEGNGRMVTSLPRIHVAVMGMEKVIPSHDRPHGVPGHPGPERDGAEAVVVHDAGARAAPGRRARGAGGVPPDPAGQRPRRARSRARCGRRSTACAAAPASMSARSTARSAATPTATRIRGPSASSSPRCSRATASVKELAHASSLCGACKDVCPVRIDIPRMLVELREQPRPGEDRARGASGSSSRRSAGCCMSPDRVPALGRGSGACASGRSSGTGGCAACRSSSASGRPPAICRRWRRGPSASAGRSSRAMTTRAEFLGRIRREIAKTPRPLRRHDRAAARRDPRGGRGGRAAAAGRALAGGARALPRGVRARGGRVPPRADRSPRCPPSSVAIAAREAARGGGGLGRGALGLRPAPGARRRRARRSCAAPAGDDGEAARLRHRERGGPRADSGSRGSTSPSRRPGR